MEMAGVAHKDIDVVQLYDAFTINTIMFLEDLGFVKKGEGGAFVESGAIAPYCVQHRAMFEEDGGTEY